MSGITLIDIWNSFKRGVVVALVVSPGVNGFNRVSVVCGERGISTKEALKQIYQGTVTNSAFPAKRSLRNFAVGWVPYMFRELPRCAFKPIGAQFLMPFLEKHYNTATNPRARGKVSATFSGAMALCDTVITPLDGIRVRIQAGKSAIPSHKEAGGRNRLGMISQGAVANIFRQYAVWWTWANTEQPVRKWIQDILRLDPEKVPGFIAQSFIQAIPITVISYIPERVKNHLQANPLHTQKGKSRYVTAIKQIVHTQGPLGLVKGMFPKIGATAFLVMGFNFLVNQGRKKLVNK